MRSRESLSKHVAGHRHRAARTKRLLEHQTDFDHKQWKPRPQDRREEVPVFERSLESRPGRASPAISGGAPYRRPRASLARSTPEPSATARSKSQLLSSGPPATPIDRPTRSATARTGESFPAPINGAQGGRIRREQELVAERSFTRRPKASPQRPCQRRRPSGRPWPHLLEASSIVSMSTIGGLRRAHAQPTTLDLPRRRSCFLDRDAQGVGGFGA